MSRIPLNLAFEDQVSEFVMTKMSEYAQKFIIGYSYSEGGFGYIKRNIRGWNSAAKGCPFFILTNLDNTECPSLLINKWLNEAPHQNLIFRIAVREVEAWLLADIEGFSSFTGVPAVNFHEEVEKLNNPKEELIRIARRSRKRNIKDDIVPRDDFAKIGPNYNERLCEFVISYWDIERARKRSQSLNKAVSKLINFEWHNN
jgi:hypothetical protein